MKAAVRFTCLIVALSKVPKFKRTSSFAVLKQFNGSLQCIINGPPIVSNIEFRCIVRQHCEQKLK